MTSIKKHTFTIIEVLVAIVILMIIMSFLASLVYRVDQISRRQNQQSELFRDQRLLMSILQQDLQGLVVSNSDTEPIYYGISKPLEYYAFISNTDLGITSTDSSLLQQVRYVFEGDGTDSQVVRWFSTQSTATWKFTQDGYRTDTMAWATNAGDDGSATNDDLTIYFTDSAVVATNVDTFFMQAYDAGGSVINSTDSSYPAYIKTTVRLIDEADNTIREFQRKIHFNRGEQ